MSKRQEAVSSSAKLRQGRNVYIAPLRGFVVCFSYTYKQAVPTGLTHNCFLPPASCLLLLASCLLSNSPHALAEIFAKSGASAGSQGRRQSADFTFRPPPGSA